MRRAGWDLRGERAQDRAKLKYHHLSHDGMTYKDAEKVTILRYGEIFLKGGNKIVFFRRLISNVQKFCNQKGLKPSVKREGGRIVISGLHVPDAAMVCGVTSASPAWKIRSVEDLAKIKDILIQMAKDAGIETHATMRVKTKRGNKQYPHTSQQVSAKIGEFFVEAFGTKVDLKNPSFEFGVDIIGNHFYLHTQTIPGVGGLPVDAKLKVVSLISGGIDSPVASFLMNKRGCKNIYVHFSSRPHTTKQSENKVKKLVEKLNSFQFRSKLYIVQIGKIQKYLSTRVHGSLLIIFYRRMMLRIADDIRKKERAIALVTGDNLGQVASQTLLNMTAIQEAISTPVLRPLLTYDKSETMQLAERIGTMEISKLPFDDCCTLFVPKHPETQADKDKIREIEDAIFDDKLKDMLKEASESAEIFEFE